MNECLEKWIKNFELEEHMELLLEDAEAQCRELARLHKELYGEV